MLDNIDNKESNEQQAAKSSPREDLGGPYRVAFKMQLFPGLEEEYKKRHNEIWPDLQELLKQNGISEYSIFLDETTNSLFGVLKAEDPKLLDELPKHEVMQRWWKYMRDMMESNSDNSPVSLPLKEVFYLP